VLDFPYFDLYFIGRPLNVMSAMFGSALRTLSGEFMAKGIEQCKRPVRTLQLYEMEACPYCRKVREALSTLDLDVEVYPCPVPSLQGDDYAGRFRPRVADEQGKTKVPVLVDDGRTIRGSEEIVEHLWTKYGAEAIAPWNYNFARRIDRTPLFHLPLLMRLRPSCGLLRAPSREPEKPLVLWGFEPSPFVKIVREALCILELPYLRIHAPHGSTEKRRRFLELYGSKMRQGSARRSAGVIQVPMLLDPNNKELKGEPMFESTAIVKYLHATYGKTADSDKVK